MTVGGEWTVVLRHMGQLASFYGGVTLCCECVCARACMCVCVCVRACECVYLQ